MYRTTSWWTVKLHPPPFGTKEMRLGIRDILVNSSIVDKRALLESKPLLVDNWSIPIENKILGGGVTGQKVETMWEQL